MARKPKIITLTIRRLLDLARELERGELRDSAAEQLRAWVKDLRDTDARETRPDPRLRKAKGKRNGNG